MTEINWHSTWWAIVNEYTTRDLTYPSDKLNAILDLGVSIYDHLPREDKCCSTRSMSHTLQQYPTTGKSHIYLAGLWWFAEMTSGLLWYVDLRSDKDWPKNYRAPSWSWASVDGVISNDSLNFERHEADTQNGGVSRRY
jgi:hypothetical protein